MAATKLEPPETIRKKCVRCNGVGRWLDFDHDDRAPEVCPDCDGHGSYEVPNPEAFAEHFKDCVIRQRVNQAVWRTLLKGLGHGNCACLKCECLKQIDRLADMMARAIKEKE